MEEWILLGESGSDVDTVQFIDGSDGSASNKASETSFTTVQIGANHRAAAGIPSGGGDQELPASPIGGENEDDGEESGGRYGWFDLDLPALAGSKAVFGPSGDCPDSNLAARFLCMGGVGSDAGMIQGAETEYTDSDADDDENPERRTPSRHLDDIDMESIGPADGDGIEHPERRVCAHIDNDQSSDAAKVVIYDDIDTESSDPGESDYDIDTESSDADEEKPERHLDDIDTESVCAVATADDVDTQSSDGSESDYSDDGTESSDTEESYYTDDGTESCDASGTTGGGDDNSNFAFSMQVQRLAAGASTAAPRPPTAPHLFFPNRAGASTAASRAPNAPLFLPVRAGASAAVSRPPVAPHLYFRSRAGA